MIGGRGSDFYFSHGLPCVNGMDQAIILVPKEKPNVTPKNPCTCCKLPRHKVADGADFERVYLRPKPQ